MSDQPRDPSATSPIPSSSAASEKTTPYIPPDKDAVTRTEPGGSPSAARSGDGAAELAGRYVLLGELGRGGMGVVLAARDPVLGRPLAVKVLLPEHRDRPELIQRFLDEARIHGQLQHPGIAPVYDMGRLADQRPFFSLKLVEGRTLASLLAARRDPADNQAHLLAIFEQVCQTIAYAHARRIIHRDLKPSNIMVGAFNEVQVMDWGLAKALSSSRQSAVQTEVHAQPAEAHSSSLTLPDSQLSQAGAVMGTPAYLPPEQARGAVDEIDERSDVFGLGAILCMILTGKPPYVGSGPNEVFRKAEQADLADAYDRLQASDADPDLVALARSCLAADPAERPSDAGVVALAITSYRAEVEERLQEAELKRAAAQARAAAERKARRWTASLSLAIVLLTILSGAGWIWLQHQQNVLRAQQQADREERRQQTRQAVQAHLQRATQLYAQARASSAGDLSPWNEAIAAAREAQRQLDQGEPDPQLQKEVHALLARLEPEQKDRSMLLQLEAARLKKTELKNEDFDLAAAVPAYAAAFRDYGIYVEKLPASQAAHRIRRSAIAGELIAALDDWAALVEGQQRAHLREVLQQADTDVFRTQLRRALQERDPQELVRMARAREVNKLPPSTLYLLGRALAHVRRHDEAAELLLDAQRRHPRDFWITFQLGEQMQAQPKPDPAAAVRHYTTALGLRGPHPLLYCCIADALAEKKDYEEAVDNYRQALRVQPRFLYAHMNLGILLARTGRQKEALDELHEVLQLDPGLFKAHNNLGNALADLGRVDEAIAEYRRALDLNPHYSRAWQNLALALGRKGQTDEGIAAARKAIACDPDNRDAYMNLGTLLEDRGKLTDALAAYRDVLRRHPDFGGGYLGLANALHQAGDNPGAIDALRQGIRLHAAEPGHFIFLGDLLFHEKHYADALGAYREAIRLKPRRAQGHRKLGLVFLNLGLVGDAATAFRDAIRLEPSDSDSHLALAQVYQRTGKLDAALQECQRALESCRPNDPVPHYILAGVLHALDRLPEAARAYRQAIRLNPKMAAAHNNLGNVLGEMGQRGEAIAAYREALRLNPNFDGAATNLGRTQLRNGDVDGAIRTYEQLLQRNPRSAEGWCLLGQALQEKGEFNRALKALHRGHELGSHLPSGTMIQNCERRLHLDSKLPLVLQGKTPPLDAQDRLEYALLCYRNKKLYLAAARLYREALSDAPKPPDDPRQSSLFLASCAAVQASRDLKDAERSQWRKQALKWLEADLAGWKQLLAREPAAAEALRARMHEWQQEAALQAVRQPAALARLPEDEQKAWRKFWEDVQALSEKVQKKAGFRPSITRRAV